MKFSSKPSLFTAMVLAVGTKSISAFTPKKILVAFDGTGNNARDFAPKFDEGEDIDQSITNVLKLHLLAGGDINNRRNDIPGQVCLYKRGVGGESKNQVVAKLNMAKGELRQQTIPMRKMLEEVYEEGDKLFIIGYSRGAASARQFVSELSEEGLKTSNGELVEKPPVEFLGCFETVSMQVEDNLRSILRNSVKGAITKASVVGEIDGKLSPIVKTAVHNLALDDNRFSSFKPAPYPPVFMDSDDDRIHEAWFAGEHGDVGGTYYTKGMPDTSCKYMQEWMESSGFSFIESEEIHPDCLKIDDFPEVNINKMDLDIVPDSSDKLHLNKQQRGKPSHRPVITVTNEEEIEDGTVRVHKSVLEHMEAMEAKGTPYLINPEIKEANIVVVGSLDKELEEETKKLKELLSN